MSGNVTKYEGVAELYQGSGPSGMEVMELLLPLSNDQFLALERAAHSLSLTVGQLIRRTVSDYLVQCNRAE